MSKKKKWPRWIRIIYFKKMDVMNRSYRGCANDAKMLIDMLDRLQISKSEVIHFSCNDEPLSDREIEVLFELVEKVRREKEEHEKRKTSK